VIRGAARLVLEGSTMPRRAARASMQSAGYGATSDGFDMVAPSGEGACAACRWRSRTSNPPIDYINPHATSTRSAISKEIEAIREVSATSARRSRDQSLTGHSLGARRAGGDLLDPDDDNGFICESANIETLDPAFADMPIGANAAMT